MPKKEVAEKQNTNLSIMNMEEDASQGFEQMGQDDFVMPFLRILQKTSPAVDEDDPEYIENAKPGMFINTATKELFEAPVSVVPCAYERTFLEWEPNQGGLVGTVSKDDALKLPKDESGRGITDAGNEVFDTRNHFMLLLTDNGPQPVLMSFKSTQIKKSKTWNTVASNLRIDGKNGKFMPPLFSHIYQLDSVTESNDHGTWKGSQLIGSPTLIEDPELYIAAKEFSEMVSKGEAKVDHEANTETGSAPSSSSEAEEFGDS